MSGYARYVGRVGGLAFALGVGAAVLAGTGVARADTTGSGTGGTGGSERTSASSSSPSSQDAETGPGPAKSDSMAKAKARAKAKAKAELTEKAESDSEANAEGGSEAEMEPSRPHRRPLRSPAQLPTPPAEAQLPTPPAAAEDVVEPMNTHPVLRAANVGASTPIMSAVAAAAAPNPFFNNQTPTLAYDPAENKVVDGHIEGNLHPVDPDSTKLTYTATKPALGTVVINPSGTFDYTPGVNYAGQDMFDVTVSDAVSGFHLHGFAGLLNLLSFGLLGTSGHKKTETVFIGDQRTVIASGLNSPVDFRFLPDGRIVVAEKGGAIKVIGTDGTVLAQPLITLSVNTLGERGVSGLAVDPQFATNGHIYVAYTTSGIKDRLSRFTVTGNTAAPGSEKVLLETTDTVGTNHHGGALAFGPDGKLYWGKGDNGSGANAQNLTNIYGKILRINPDGSTPSDNPVLPAGALPQIYAYGLRNPFRLTFTPTGQLLVADVGNAAFEELNRVTAGGNYGWPGAEGICTSNCTGLINPIYTYARGSGAAFTSVLVYDSAKVFIADEVQGWIKVLTCNSTFTLCGDPQDFDLEAGTTVAMARGPGTDGGLYQLTYQPGTLVRIAKTSSS